MSQGCDGKSGDKLIFACSGAADVGALSDQAARKLTKEGLGKMYCLAGVGGRVPGIMQTTEAAEQILAIDGCNLDCVKKTLEQAELKNFIHLRVTDLGLEKGKSDITNEAVEKVAIAGRDKLGQ